MSEDRTTERVDHPPRVREAIDELMRKKDATDNRTTELLNCPFCGGEASVIGDSESGYAAYCLECIDGGHTEVGWYGTRADAIEAWNTRYDPIEDARIVEVETSHIDIEQGEVITRFVPEQAIAATLGSEREKELETLVKQLWYLVNHRSGYGYAAALEAIDELGIEVIDE